MADQPTIGKDVTVYNVTAIGTFNLIGRWEEISITFKNNWAVATPSDATEPVKRQTTYEWSATLSTFMDSIYGSPAMTAAFQTPIVTIVFTESNSGKTITATGGVDEAAFTANMEAWKDKLNVSSVGPVNGAPSIHYA